MKHAENQHESEDDCQQYKQYKNSAVCGRSVLILKGGVAINHFVAVFLYVNLCCNQYCSPKMVFQPF
jgi:hypothetical protein